MTEERDVLLLIADISGYTRFMLTNQTALAHSHEIVFSLLDAIISEVEIPLHVAKLEGDAVFLYAIKGPDARPVLDCIRGKLGRFFSAFSLRLRELALSRSCTCNACRNIDALRLKIVLHSGKAAVYSVAGMTDLSGVDVIIAHRLLKNTVPSREYVLLTEAAQRDLRLDVPPLWSGDETYDEIGSIRVIAFEPSVLIAPPPR